MKGREHTGALEHEGDGIAAVVGLQRDDVVVAGALEHFRHVVEVHPHGDVSVAAVVLEALRPEQQRHQRHVAGVHGLQREPGCGAVEVRIGNQLLDRFQNLLQQASLHQPKLQHLPLITKEMGTISDFCRENSGLG